MNHPFLSYFESQGTDIRLLSRFSPKRLGFSSQTLGIPVPNAWDFCPIRLGFLSQTLGNRWDDSFMRMVRAMLCGSFTFIGHIAHLKKTVKDGKDSKNPNFFRKYRNRNSPIHIFVFFEKVLKQPSYLSFPSAIPSTALSEASTLFASSVLFCTKAFTFPSFHTPLFFKKPLIPPLARYRIRGFSLKMGLKLLILRSNFAGNNKRHSSCDIRCWASAKCSRRCTGWWLSGRQPEDGIRLLR